MKNQIRYLSVLAIVTSLTLSSTAHSQNAAADIAEKLSDISFEAKPLNIEVILDDRNPIQFKPFTLDDFCKEKNAEGICLIRFTPKEIAELAKVNLSTGGAALYSGSLENLVAEFNKMEEELTKRGVSLRDSLPTIDYSKIPVDVEGIRKEIISKLGAVSSILPKVKDPLTGDACPMLPLEKLDSIPAAAVEMSDGKVAKLKSLAKNINQAQSGLCSIGYSLTQLAEQFDTSEIESWKKKLLSSSGEKSKILEDLGISEYADAFSNIDMEEVQAIGDLAKDLFDIAKKGEFPGPEQINALQTKLNDVLPEEYQIPRIPQIEIPDYPVRKDWALKKQKTWEVRYGNPSQLSVGADAALEIRGNTSKQQQYSAHAEVATSILGNHISYLKAQGQATIEPTETDVKLSAYMLGEEIFKPINHKEQFSFRLDNGEKPIVWKPKSILKYEQQFTIGPIPAFVAVRADIQIGYTYYLAGNFLSVSGQIRPFAQGSVSGEFAIGVRNILSAGIDGQVNLINLAFPLSGSADLRFLGGGEPQLTLKLNADAEYTLLSGQISAYVEYPDWKKLFMGTKKASTTIFSFPGTSSKAKIMDYKMVLGPTGTQLSGTMIDKADADESNKLEEQILLDARKKALAKYEEEVASLQTRTWEAIDLDLGSDSNKAVTSLSQTTDLLHEQMMNNSSALTNSIVETAR